MDSQHLRNIHMQCQIPLTRVASVIKGNLSAGKQRKSTSYVEVIITSTLSTEPDCRAAGEAEERSARLADDKVVCPTRTQPEMCSSTVAFSSLLASKMPDPPSLSCVISWPSASLHRLSSSLKRFLSCSKLTTSSSLQISLSFPFKPYFCTLPEILSLTQKFMNCSAFHGSPSPKQIPLGLILLHFSEN